LTKDVDLILSIFDKIGMENRGLNKFLIY